MPGRVDESKWEAAKKKVTEEYGTEEKIGNEKFYALTTTIYKKMGGEFKKEASKLEKLYNSLQEENKEGAELTSKGRKQISTKNFALEEERKYPIHDIEHARNALARVSAHGTPEEKKEVKREVANKYPSLKQD